MASDLKIFGPYKRGDGWRCLLGNGRKRSPLPTRKTEAEALRFAELALRHLRAETPLTIPEVLESYQAHLELTNRPRAVTTAMFRLKSLLPDPSGSLRSLTPAKCQSRYMDLVKRQKPDTHRNALQSPRVLAAGSSKKNMSESARLKRSSRSVSAAGAKSN